MTDEDYDKIIEELEAEIADLKAKLATCKKYRDAYAECDRIATQAVRDLEAKLSESEALLAKAVEALERIEDASKYFGNCPEASETTVRYAHETTRRLARTTLAELTGGNDE